MDPININVHFISDMAFNRRDQKMYVTYYESGTSGVSVGALDLYTAQVTKVADLAGVGSDNDLDLDSLAIDNDGNFYGVSYEGGDYPVEEGSEEKVRMTAYTLYTYTVGSAVEGVITPVAVGDGPFKMEEGSPSGTPVCTWDLDHNELVYTFASELYRVKLETADGNTTVTVEQVASFTDAEAQMSGVATLNTNAYESADLFPAAAAATDVTLSKSALNLLVGNQATLTAKVYPWTLADQSVTWTSSNDSIATVAGGVVTAVAEGTATITATSAATDTVEATCAVTVTKLDVTLLGALQDADGNPQLFRWDLASGATWAKTVDIKPSMTSGTYDEANNQVVIMDADNNILHTIDPTTGETVETYPGCGAPYWDMAYMGLASYAYEAPMILGIYRCLILGGATYESFAQEGADGWNLQAELGEYTGADYFTAIAYAGFDDFAEEGSTEPAYEDIFYLLDNAGCIWVVSVSLQGKLSIRAVVETDLPDLAFAGDGGSNIYCSMIVDSNDTIYLSYYNAEADTSEIYV